VADRQASRTTRSSVTRRAAWRSASYEQLRDMPQSLNPTQIWRIGDDDQVLDADRREAAQPFSDLLG
jgi:hypothetical protein